MAMDSKGRMISVEISLSQRISNLSPHALSLFCMLIPHFNAHGKMLANPHLIKGLVCPLIEWMTVDMVEASLMEISDKTNVKFWKDEKGNFYLHSVNWKEHQKLRESRLGPDHLPDYPGALPEHSRTTPGLLPPEVEGKEEVEGKGKEEDKAATMVDIETGGDESTVAEPAAPVFSRMPISKAQSLYVRYFGKLPMNQNIGSVLGDICRTYPSDRIEEAFQAAGAAQAQSLNWILKRLQDNQLSAVDEVFGGAA